jgi:hypothetical protein
LVVLLVVAGNVLVSGCATGFGVPPSDRTTTSATLEGVVASTRTEQGQWWFRYGKTTAYGNETTQHPIAFTELTAHEVSEPINGLDPGTVYHYVGCAVDQQPGVNANCSRDRTFRTIATRDSVVVTGSESIFSNIDIDVSSGPSGENPTGHATVGITGIAESLKASSITCLSVNGNTATIAGSLEPNGLGYPGFRVTVQDNGDAPGHNDLDAFDAIGADPSTDCSWALSVTPRSGDGDAIVMDAP